MAYPIQQGNTTRPLIFLMVDSADHITPKTGLTPTVTLSKAGGSLASPAGAVAEIGQGLYRVAANATDANTLGPLVLHATATGADPSDTMFEVVAYNPDDAVRLGLTALPNVAQGNSGALPTGDTSGRVQIQYGTSTGQVNLSAGNLAGPVPSVTGPVGSVTGNVGGNVVGSVGSVTAGVTVTTNNDKTGYSLSQAFPTNFSAMVLDLNGRVQVQYGTSAGQINLSAGNLAGAVPSVSGAVGSVTGNVGGNLSGNVLGSVSGSVASVAGAVGSVTGSVGSVTGPVGSVTGNVGGNVVGSVASVAGAVGSVTGGVGGDVSGKVLGGGASAFTGDGVRASSVTGAVGSVTGAVGSVTGPVGSVTGNVGGNVAGSVGSVASFGTLIADIWAAIPANLANMATRFLGMIEAIPGGGGLYRYLAGALSQAPAGGGGGGSTSLVLLRGLTLQIDANEPGDTLRLMQGSDLSLLVTLLDGSGDPVPLTGFTTTAQIRATDGSVVLSPTVTVQSAATGQVLLAIPASFTATAQRDLTLTVKLDGGTGNIHITYPTEVEVRAR